jgi:hypothetical protein
LGRDTLLLFDAGILTVLTTEVGMYVNLVYIGQGPADSKNDIIVVYFRLCILMSRNACRKVRAGESIY